MGTREEILDAAAEVMRTQGLARATTKVIARAAGYSEATLYKHFEDKTELLVAVLRERSPGLAALARALPDQPGGEPVQAHLTRVAAAAISFYDEAFPMLASIFSDPELLATHRSWLRAHDTGPHHPVVALADYLRGEQDLGRLGPGADPLAAASLLLGACMQHAFLGHMGWAQRRSDADAAAALVSTLLGGVVG